MKIKYFFLPNRFSSIFITGIVFIYLCYSIEGIFPLYGTRKSNTKVSEKYCQAPELFSQLIKTKKGTLPGEMLL